MRSRQRSVRPSRDVSCLDALCKLIASDETPVRRNRPVRLDVRTVEHALTATRRWVDHGTITSGRNTVITYNGFFTVTLNGVTTGQLTAADFLSTCAREARIGVIGRTSAWPHV